MLYVYVLLKGQGGNYHAEKTNSLPAIHCHPNRALSLTDTTTSQSGQQNLLLGNENQRG